MARKYINCLFGREKLLNSPDICVAILGKVRSGRNRKGVNQGKKPVRGGEVMAWGNWYIVPMLRAG